MLECIHWLFVSQNFGASETKGNPLKYAPEVNSFIYAHFCHIGMLIGSSSLYSYTSSYNA